MILTNREGLAGGLIMRVWNSVLDEEKAGKQVSLQPQTYGELMLASSRIFLEEFRRNRSCRVKVSKRDG